MNVGELFEVLGISAESLQQVQEAETEDRACELLADLQARVRRGVRQVAREWHPDVIGEDEAGGAFFREVLEASAEVQRWKVVWRVPSKIAAREVKARAVGDSYVRRYDYSYGESTESEYD